MKTTTSTEKKWITRDDFIKKFMLYHPIQETIENDEKFLRNLIDTNPYIRTLVYQFMELKANIDMERKEELIFFSVFSTFFLYIKNKNKNFYNSEEK